MNYRPALILCILAAGPPRLCLALEARTSAAFLKIPVGTRAVGMGSAYVGLSDDIYALYWNPGGLGQLRLREVGFTHTELFQDVRYQAAAYAQPTSLGVFGLGIAHLSQGQIEGRSADRARTGTFKASDLLLTLAFGRPTHTFFGDGFVGGTVKLVRSQLADVRGEAVAADLGLLTSLPVRNLSFGASLRNLGSGLRYLSESFPLPLTLATGLAYRIPAGVILAADLTHQPHNQVTSLSLGADYSVLPFLFLRGGYLATLGAQGVGSPGATGILSQLQGMGMGMGMRLSRYTFDYAFTPFGELGNSQRFGVGVRF